MFAHQIAYDKDFASLKEEGLTRKNLKCFDCPREKMRD
jgi:hypothetical protein